MHYLYRITNLANTKVYIGQTVDPHDRKRAHFKYNLRKPVQYIHRAMAKHGVENFTFEIIAQCMTQDQANDLEVVLIAQYNSKAPNGYNVDAGGNNSPRSEETKEKLRQTLLGVKHTDERRQNIARAVKERFANGEEAWNKGLPAEEQPRYGASHTEETKQKMRQAAIANGNGDSLKLSGMKTRFKRAFDHDEIIRLYKLGMKKKDIALQLGCSKTTVTQVTNK